MARPFRSALYVAAVTCTAAVIALPSAGWPQTYPSKPVLIVVPIAAGGGTDNTARIFAQKYAEVWKQQVIVDNRAGAGGNIGADVVAKAAPDGYTLLFTPGGIAVSASLYRKLPFDPRRDFAPATQVASTHMILVTNPKFPAASVKEVIALAKAQPGKLNFGSSGVGAPSHLMGEVLKATAGLDIVHIPYKGDAQSIPALLAGEVHMVFVPLLIALPHMKNNRLRGVAVIGAARPQSAPEVPTMVESGLRDFQFTGWQGIFAPAGTPQEVLSKISADTVKVLRMPDLAGRLPGMGLEAAGTSPAEFAVLYKSDIEKYARVIREARIPLID